ncbi:hypothetical protein GYB22_11455 [bacterium]|nr:hypothetical protein [bacterium]
MSKESGLKPQYILIALLALNGVLAVVAGVFPDDGIKFGGGLSLKFPDISSVFSAPDEGVVVDMDDVLQDIAPVDFDSTPEPIDTASESLKQRIATQIKSSINFDTSTGKLKNLVARSIQFPDSNEQALAFFLNALINESNKKVIRILHYGDSQLEGDRITDYLRNRMQMLFGGEGPGIVLPLEPTWGMRRSATVQHSANFEKYAIYKQGSKPEGRKYGIGTAAFEIKGITKNVIGYDTSYQEVLNEEDSSMVMDTVITPLYEDVKQTTAFWQVKNAKSSYPKVRSYSQVRLMYSADEPFTLKITADTVVKKEQMKSTSFGIASWDLTVQQKLRLDFAEGQFPKVYGLALDGEHGVAVDNFPMRGSAALGFDGMNSAFYGRQLKEMGVKLIVLQYGVNVIPGILKDYTYYRVMLTKQLEAIKAAYPDVSILVIGPSDMSMNSNGVYVSYPNIPLIRDAMKEAAFSTGCAFWDLYEAMGGENSMRSWVQGGYAQKDYTHFSFKGAKFVGEMLFEALLEQIQNQGYIN